MKNAIVILLTLGSQLFVAPRQLFEQLLVVTLDSCRIRHTPMRQDRLPGKHRTHLPRLVTNRDDEVPLFALQPVQPPGPMSSPFDAALGEDLESIGLTRATGREPALSAVKRPRPFRFSTASAIWLRPELPVHRKSTR